jgi:magnesium transporter
VPLGIILAKNYLITVCKVESDILRELSASQIKTLSPAKQERFVLYTFLRTAQKYLSDLREINKTVDVLEDELQLSTRNKELMDLLKYQKSLTYFTTALKSNELMMERLRRNGMFTNYPEDQDLLEDVLTENQQAIEMTSIASNILSSMMDAFASIISNNLNSVMKLLASITIVLSIPIMVASFYGMNVNELPFADLNHAFLIIFGISVVLTLGVFLLFYKRDWL